MSNEVIGKNIAIKFNPPVLAFEYTYKKTLTDYLLEVSLSEKLRNMDNPNPEAICEWLFATYSDIINKDNFSDKQIINLIHRIVINYKTTKL